MIALDALSAYWVSSHTEEERELNVTLSSVGRNGFKSYVLQLNTRQSQGQEEELQVSHTLTTPGPAARGQNFPVPCPCSTPSRQPRYPCGKTGWLRQLESQPPRFVVLWK